MKSTVSAVIINRNGRRYLNECLENVTRSSGVFSECLFVDDASDDGSAEFVAEKFPLFRVLRTGVRAGPGAARNLGLDAASSDYILVMDGDTALEPGCAVKLIDAIERAGAAAAFPRVFIKGGIPQYGPGRVNCLGLSVYEDYWGAAGGGAGPYSCASSAVFLLKKQKFRFDADYFTPGEDTDFFLRLAMSGAKLMYVRDAGVLHMNDRLSGGGVRFDRAAEAERAFYHWRNRRFTMFKCFSIRTMLLTVPAQAACEALLLLNAARARCLRAYFKGVAATFAALPAVLAKRREFSGLKRLADAELLAAAGVQARPGIFPARGYYFLLNVFNRGLRVYCRLLGFA